MGVFSTNNSVVLGECCGKSAMATRADGVLTLPLGPAARDRGRWWWWWLESVLCTLATMHVCVLAGASSDHTHSGGGRANCGHTGTCGGPGCEHGLLGLQALPLSLYMAVDASDRHQAGRCTAGVASGQQIQQCGPVMGGTGPDSQAAARPRPPACALLWQYQR